MKHTDAIAEHIAETHKILADVFVGLGLIVILLAFYLIV